MPELPEVETTMRALAARLAGRRVTSLVQRRADIRFPLPADLPARLQGRTMVRFARRAKYIECVLDDGAAILLHLGMSGRLLFDGEPAGPHEHLTFVFDDGTVLRFVDPRRFGMLDLWPADQLDCHHWLRHLGLEPLDAGFDGRSLARSLAGRRTALKVALMDQRLVVGVGNIYASESLFRAGISPRRRAGRISLKEAARLVAAVKATLQAAIRAGGSTLRDFANADGESGYAQQRHFVYDRAGLKCRRCRTPIRKPQQGQRSTYYCPTCQR